MASKALFALHDDWMRQGCYPEAARCLLAVLKAGGLPSEVAQAHLMLGRLLLNHFENCAEAKAHLLKAELVLRSSAQHSLLKCEVFDTLALCHRVMGADSQELEALTAGLRFVQQVLQAPAGRNASADRSTLARYAICWQFKLAKHALSTQSAGAALAQLQPLERPPAELTPTEQALLLLGRALLHLYDCSLEAANQDLAACPPVLDGLAAAGDAGEPALRLQYLLLYISLAIATGRIMDMQQGGDFTLLSELQEQLGEVASAGSAAWPCSWLPPAAVTAVTHLVHGSLLRNTGKLTSAAVQIGQAEEVVDQQLKHSSLDLQQAEKALSLQAVWQGRRFAQLKLMILEQRALAAMQATNYAQAGALLGEMVAAVQRLPLLLRECKPSLHMLIGHYASCIGEHVAAADQFRRVLSSDATHQHHLAAAGVALACLAQDPASPAAVAQAAEVLEENGLHDRSQLGGLPTQEKVLAQLALAAMDLHRGDEAAARVLATKALRQSHVLLGNTQVVTACLNALAPIQTCKGDVAGAKSMFHSAVTLSKTVGDLASLLASVTGLKAALQQAGEAEEAEKTEQYAQRKAGELQGRIEAAQEAGWGAGSSLLHFR